MLGLGQEASIEVSLQGSEDLFLSHTLALSLPQGWYAIGIQQGNVDSNDYNLYVGSLSSYLEPAHPARPSPELSSEEMVGIPSNRPKCLWH